MNRGTIVGVVLISVAMLVVAAFLGAIGASPMHPFFWVVQSPLIVILITQVFSEE